MNLRHIVLISLLAAASMLAIGCSATGDPSATVQPDGEVVNGDDVQELAYNGNDPVSYFAIEKATKGIPQLSVVWNGARYLFANKENLEKFKVEPSKYLAQFDSHCPVSLSKGGRVHGDPSAWRVFKDRLYFFAGEGLAKQFDDDPEGVIDTANREWEKQKAN